MCALTHAAAIEALAEPWLPWKGPRCSDEVREASKAELLGALGAFGDFVGDTYVGGGEVSYGDVVVLAPVLWLWRYVLGGDVKGGLEGVGGWVGRMVGDSRVVKVVCGGT